MALMPKSRAEPSASALSRRNLPQRRGIPPAGIRLERTIRDLFGLSRSARPTRGPGWITDSWEVRHPLGAARDAGLSPYAFLPAEGESLHQIPVGPVHAGIIEPGHFRFHANGETVVRLEARLGYTHKGIEVLDARARSTRAAKLAGRVSGDSTVAYAFAFARAVEAALGVRPPPRAVAARPDGGTGASRQPPGRYRRDLQRRRVLAHAGPLRRAARTRAAGGGRMFRPSPDARLRRARRRRGATWISAKLPVLRALLAEIRERFPALVELYDNTASLQDRTVATGILKPRLRAAIRRRRLCRPRRPGAASMRDGTLPYPPYDSWPSRSRFCRRATSTPASGSASVRSSRAWR